MPITVAQGMTGTETTSDGTGTPPGKTAPGGSFVGTVRFFLYEPGNPSETENAGAGPFPEGLGPDFTIINYTYPSIEVSTSASTPPGTYYIFMPQNGEFYGSNTYYWEVVVTGTPVGPPGGATYAKRRVSVVLF